MKRHELIENILTPILEIIGVVALFFLAYNLRQITDGIPGIQLPIPYISKEQFIPFVISGTLFWGVIFSIRGVYDITRERSFFGLIQSIILSASIWFLFYIGFVYLTTGFLFTREIPRLSIIYVAIFSTLYSILIRVFIYSIKKYLYKAGFIEPQSVLIIGDSSKQKIFKDEAGVIYRYSLHMEDIELLLREKKVSKVLMISPLSESERAHIIKLCSIYGIIFSYPKILPEVYSISQKESFIGDMPVIETRALRIGAWGRFLKRGFDIVLSSIGILILAPIYLIIALFIKAEDPAGPAIFRNLRVGFSGKEFFLYKFRYMYWRYSVKDAYGIPVDHDEAMKYEESLKKESDTRSGPLYKIKDDPRKTRVGKLIEKLSLDELPQLYNVLKGDMSLVGPRPHQPREVALYEERHYQVLTAKPGITGMAQVFGREKNSFEDEVRYDIYYIEHYSLLLDILIIGKTFFVVLRRALGK